MSSGLPGGDTPKYASGLPGEDIVIEQTTRTTASLRDLVPGWYKSARPSQKTASQEAFGYAQGGHGSREDQAAKSARIKEASARYQEEQAAQKKATEKQLLHAYEQGNLDFNALCQSLGVDASEASKHVSQRADTEAVPRDVAAAASSPGPQVRVQGYDGNYFNESDGIPSGYTEVAQPPPGPEYGERPGYYGEDPLQYKDPTPSWDRSAAQEAQDAIRPAAYGSTVEEEQAHLTERFAQEMDRVASINDPDARRKALVRVLDLYITVPQVRRSPLLQIQELSKFWNYPSIPGHVLAAVFGVMETSTTVDLMDSVLAEPFQGTSGYDLQPEHMKQYKQASQRPNHRRPVAMSIREYLDTIRK